MVNRETKPRSRDGSGYPFFAWEKALAKKIETDSPAARFCVGYAEENLAGCHNRKNLTYINAAIIFLL
jgi:hypothetical protein